MDRALLDALHLFWEIDYERATVHDLRKVMGRGFVHEFTDERRSTSS